MSDVWATLMLIAGGLFAGGAATFAWSRVPIWERMELREFITDFEETIRWTDKVQPALLVVAAGSAIGFAIAVEDTARRVLSAAGAGGLMLVLLASLAVMVPLQRKIIVTPASQEAELEAMRSRWFTGNLGRSVLSVTSFALLVVAVVV
jgi:hypothetical protein